MKVHLTAIPGQLLFRHPFRIAHGIRTSTEVVFIRAECGNAVGFGEATLPPYLGITTEDVLHFFSLPIINDLRYPFVPDDIAVIVDQQIPGMMPAKAALNMALWSVFSSLKGMQLSRFMDVNSSLRIPHTYTIGVCDKTEFAEKVNFAISNEFNFFKLKLDGVHDRQMIDTYAELSNAPFAVDINQGWKDVGSVLDFTEELSKLGCVLIEQPFHRDDLEQTASLRSRCNIPIIADEACQRLSDIERIHGAFDGVNVKLQKCGGLSEARKMIARAREFDLKVLIGCMSESSVGCDAAEILAPICDWADLDGPWLIRNDAELLSEIGYKKSLR